MNDKRGLSSFWRNHSYHNKTVGVMGDVTGTKPYMHNNNRCLFNYSSYLFQWFFTAAVTFDPSDVIRGTVQSIQGIDGLWWYLPYFSNVRGWYRC